MGSTVDKCPFCQFDSVEITCHEDGHIARRMLCTGPVQHEWQYDTQPVEEAPAETLPIELL